MLQMMKVRKLQSTRDQCSNASTILEFLRVCDCRALSLLVVVNQIGQDLSNQ